MDLILASALLVLLAPVMVTAMVLVRLTSHGPAIYSQTRLGRGGRTFTIYKLRTMYDGCERLTGPRWSTPGDPRVTPVGRVLRATHVDELPQLWNIIRGEMSLVGPRPERPEIAAELEKVLPCYRDRLMVHPGVTGLAQVQLPPDTDIRSVQRKLAYDLYYIGRASLWLDVRIMIATALGASGLPFAMARNLLRIPSSEVVETAYRDLSGGMNLLPQAAETLAHCNVA
jgi:lipopolysaccharide/colanic/teichoic acid biosynthesis glycosyltransferase